MLPIGRSRVVHRARRRNVLARCTHSASRAGDAVGISSIPFAGPFVPGAGPEADAPVPLGRDGRQRAGRPLGQVDVGLHESVGVVARHIVAAMERLEGAAPGRGPGVDVVQRPAILAAFDAQQRSARSARVAAGRAAPGGCEQQQQQSWASSHRLPCPARRGARRPAPCGDASCSSKIGRGWTANHRVRAAVHESNAERRAFRARTAETAKLPRPVRRASRPLRWRMPRLVRRERPPIFPQFAFILRDRYHRAARSVPGFMQGSVR
jgi:hypothetical protein